MQLKDIMSTKVESVRPNATLERAHALMRRRGIHHLVVIDRGDVVGVLTESLLQIGASEGVATVADIMMRHIVAGTPDMTVRAAAKAMRGCADGALPVFAGSRLVGIVTVSDLLAVLAGRERRPGQSPVARTATRDTLALANGSKPKCADVTSKTFGRRTTNQSADTVT
jgi:CBS-domain-containing membrane protein